MKLGELSKHNTIYTSPKTGETLFLNEEDSYQNADKSEIYRIKNGVPYFSNVTSFGEKETQRVFGAEWQSFTDYDADNREKMSYGMEGFLRIRLY